MIYKVNDRTFSSDNDGIQFPMRCCFVETTSTDDSFVVFYL